MTESTSSSTEKISFAEFMARNGARYAAKPDRPARPVSHPCYYCGLPTRGGVCDECGSEI